MEKKKGLLIAAIIFAGVLLLGTCITVIVTMANVKAIEATLQNISISYPDSHVVYEDSGSETPSILADSSLKLAGEDTISLEDKTIGYRASVTPAEFKEGTKVKLKVKSTGKVYSLKQKENAFEGTIQLPLAEPTVVEAILKDGDTTRTEALEEKEPYIRTDVAWTATGEQPQIQEDSAIFKWDIEAMFFGEAAQEDFPEIQVMGLTDGKLVYKKTIEGEALPETEEEGVDPRWIYRWEGKVPLKGSEKVELYAVAKAEAGLAYRYKIGQAQKGMTDEFWGDEETIYLEILAPDGRVISKANPYEEEEDEI